MGGWGGRVSQKRGGMGTSDSFPVCNRNPNFGSEKRKRDQTPHGVTHSKNGSAGMVTNCHSKQGVKMPPEGMDRKAGDAGRRPRELSCTVRSGAAHTPRVSPGAAWGNMKLQGDMVLGAGPNQHSPCCAALDESLSRSHAMQCGPTQTSGRRKDQASHAVLSVRRNGSPPPSGCGSLGCAVMDVRGLRCPRPFPGRLLEHWASTNRPWGGGSTKAP